MASSYLTIPEAERRVDELVKIFQTYLKSYTDITPAEIIKGGSLGHGTAVPGDFDLDLVLYSRDLNPDTILLNGIGDTLSKLDRFLSSTLGRKYKKTKTTTFSLQFRYDDYIDVDLLPSPYWGETPEYYHYYLQGKPVKDQMKFSCSATKWQVKFFKKQPNEVKEYIKRFKAWRNQNWPKGGDTRGRPKSYLLGLLMVRAYEKSRFKSEAYIEAELHELVRNHAYIDIDWNGESRMRPPVIADVGNPYNNVYMSGIGDWAQFARLIPTFSLRTPVERY